MQSSFSVTSLVVLSLTACGPSTGPGSQTDAVRFANKRITELKQPTVKEDADGKWYKTSKEIRNASPGFVSSTWGGIRSRVQYEYRIEKSEPCDTRKAAEVREVRLVDEKWREASEVYTFEKGEWTLKATQE